MESPQHSNYQKLLALVPNLFELKEHVTLKASGFMDLHVDVLGDETGARRIALSHYYKQNGDMVPDPDMELLVNADKQTVVAQSFQTAMIYQRARSTELDHFLSQWLNNLKAQGHTASLPG